MQINNIAYNANKCIKPHKFTSFKANDAETSSKRKVRYKHYEELSDDVLCARSIIKAHQEVQKGGKMRLLKALPAIATGMVATSLAITQPGKLSSKAATGLGFLALMAGIDAIKNVIMPNQDKETRRNSFAVLGGLAAVTAGIAAMSKGGDGKVTKFITKEAGQLINEIDSTKLSKISDKYVEPFLQKHRGVELGAPLATVVAVNALSPLAGVGLLKGISKDLSKKACDNFERAKLIQQEARKHYDSIDAVEV